MGHLDLRQLPYAAHFAARVLPPHLPLLFYTGGVLTLVISVSVSAQGVKSHFGPRLSSNSSCTRNQTFAWTAATRPDPLALSTESAS